MTGKEDDQRGSPIIEGNENIDNYSITLSNHSANIGDGMDMLYRGQKYRKTESVYPNSHHLKSSQSVSCVPVS